MKSIGDYEKTKQFKRTKKSPEIIPRTFLFEKYLLVRALGFLGYRFEYRRIFHGNFGKDFAVDFDLRKLECVDESTVVHAEFSYCGIDSDLPDSAHQPFLALAVAIGIGAGLDDCHLGISVFAMSIA